MDLPAVSGPVGHSAGGGTVADRMDRLPLTWLHVAVALVAGLGFLSDLLEIALGNVLSAVFSAPPYSAAPGQLSWLLAAMYIGAVPGALAAGWLADRFGRRAVLTGILLLLAITSLAAAASADIRNLILWRMVSGLAIGAYPPLMIAFLSDIMPPRRRGTVIVMTTGLASLGPVVMIFLIRSMGEHHPLGLEAWRWAFVAGSGGALLAASLFRFVPESPRWLEARGRGAEAEAAFARFGRSPAAVAGGRSDPEPAAAKPDRSATPDPRSFATVAGIYFLTPWATVAFPVLMGAVLIQKGFALSDSLFYVGIAMFGPALATAASAVFLDRIERRMALILFACGMVGTSAAFAASFNPVWLMAVGVLSQFLAMLYVPTMTLYAAELFPTAWRARTSTAAWSVNRLASAIAPFVLVPLLKEHGVWPMFGVIIATLLLGILLVALSPEGRAGRAVD
mgnify:CR=1 FL=1